MFKVAIVVWIMLGTVLAGVAFIAVLMAPGLGGQEMNNIPRAVLTGFVLAMPLSFLIARKIAGTTVH